MDGLGQNVSAIASIMQPVTETASRLLQLLSLLQARREWPGAALAGRLETSGRTIRRDVGRLRELGYPVESTSGPTGPKVCSCEPASRGGRCAGSPRS